MLHQPTTFRIAILTLLLLCGAGGLQAAFAQCTVTRDQVQADLDAGLTAEEIDAKYAGCTASDPSTAATAVAEGALVAETDAAIPAPVPAPTTPSTQIITNTGSTFYEAIKSCGYHPQREELACTVEIRQRFGFGGQICASRGSHEFVLFCVDYNDGLGLVPVHINGFHIHDERFGVNPNWYFAAVVQSDWRLLSLPNDGRTLRARAILSWATPVRSCTGRPWWGNQADFRIRLDP